MSCRARLGATEHRPAPGRSDAALSPGRMDSPLPRRRFLQTSGAALALSALPFPLRAMAAPASDLAAHPDDPEAVGRPMPELEMPLPDPPERRVGFALVGLGAFALNQIAPNLGDTRHAKLTALVSGNADKARTVADAYGIGRDHVYSYDTFDRIADDPEVDVVYVILPNALHREWTERAFAAGNHVLCEKPLAPTAEDCEAMIAAGEAAGKRLMTAYRAQYDPYNLRAIELTQGGEIGVPRLIVADHGRILNLDDLRDQWRAKKKLAGGGSLYDIGIYNVNACRYLLGEEPTEVTARYREPSGKPGVTVEEGVEWTLAFPSMAVANCTSSYVVADNKRIHVQGSEGEVTLDPATDYYVRNLIVETDAGRREISIPQANQFARMLDEMALSARENRAPKTPGEEGLRDVRILEAIYRAADTGEAVRLDA